MAGKKRKSKKNKFPFLFYGIIILIVFWLCVGVFLFFQSKQNLQASIYVYPENPKQGDTVFIKVESAAKQVVGKLGEEKINFYKKTGTNEWISFLGIDADQTPGNFNIFADTSNGEHLTKEINISLAGFSSAPSVAAPSAGQTVITVSESVNNIITKDNPAINKILSNFTAEPYFNNPFSFPLNSIKISGFSFGKFIKFGKGKIQHLGVDLFAKENSNIYAVNDGKVVAVFNLPNYGKTVIIDHGLNIFSMYLHLDEFKVVSGDIVRRGQLVGLSGKTGYAAGPHLHFSMRVDGKRVDPLEFIKQTQQINDSSFTASITGGFLNFFK